MENKTVVNFSNVSEPYTSDIGHHSSGRSMEAGALNDGTWVTYLSHWLSTDSRSPNFESLGLTTRYYTIPEKASLCKRGDKVLLIHQILSNDCKLILAFFSPRFAVNLSY